jgi:hypothetical protein
LNADDSHFVHCLDGFPNSESGNFITGNREVGSTTVPIQLGTSATLQTEYVVQNLTFEEISESTADRPDSVDYNLIDSVSFEKALPEKNEDSQSILQART